MVGLLGGASLTMAATTCLEITQVTVDIVDLRLRAGHVGWILGYYVPRMYQPREISQQTEQNVYERVAGAEAATDPHR